MKIKDVKKLRPGDEVHWNDPDEGACSKTIRIKAVSVEGDIVCITDEDGSDLECFAHELS